MQCLLQVDEVENPESADRDERSDVHPAHEKDHVDGRDRQKGDDDEVLCSPCRNIEAAAIDDIGEQREKNRSEKRADVAPPLARMEFLKIDDAFGGNVGTDAACLQSRSP
jgi:hypothetical protein